MNKKNKFNNRFDMGDICKKTCRYRDEYKKRELESDWLVQYDNFAYFLNNEKSNKRMYELKLENMPSLLYRYKPLNDYAVDELRDGYIYLNSAKNFNDPFETIGMLSKGEFDELLDGLGENHNDIKFQYDILCMDKEMWEELEKEIGIENSISEISRKKIDAFQQTFFNLTERQIDTLSSFMSKRIRMTCFTDNNLSLPMWGHYADNHKGVCVEYMFDRKKLAANIGFFPMRYTNDFSKIHKCVQQGFERAYLYILSRKNKAWNYENEWRFTDLYFGSDNNNGMQCKQFKVKAVYLGINCNDKNKLNEIVEISKQQKFEVYKMIKTHYGLKPQLL